MHMPKKRIDDKFHTKDQITIKYRKYRSKYNGGYLHD